jgi:hypothetical protein
LLGSLVETSGVVTLDLETTYRRGFFMQYADCDGDPASSDGIFVYLGVQEERVQPGDRVRAAGLAQEYYGLTEIDASSGSLEILERGLALPTGVELSPPFDNASAEAYYESLEGMLAQAGQAAVVGPTNNSDETWVVPTSLGVSRVFQDDPRGTGEVMLMDDGGHFELPGDAKVGDQVLGLLAVLDYRLGRYRLQLLAEPAWVQDDPPAGPRELPGQITVATFNLHDFFDTVDDPLLDDPVVSATAYQRGLHKRALAIRDGLSLPTLLAVQEAENLDVLQALADQPEIGGVYQIALLEGIDPRGIDVALLYRSEQARLVSVRQLQGCTTLVDGLGPDGNGDPLQPVNQLTCDRDGDGELDGNRLFARPPLEIHVQVCPLGCGEPPAGPAYELALLVNHFKSKREDSQTVEYTLPRRLEEAQFVAAWALATHQLQPQASLLVLGDLNDYPASPPLQALTGAGLLDLAQLAPHSTRYTYIYQGVSQELDYILGWLQPGLAAQSAAIAHLNADYPEALETDPGTPRRSSDHDVLWASLQAAVYHLHLPIALRTE